MSGKTKKPHYDMYDMRRLLQQQPLKSEATTFVDSDWRAFDFIYSSILYFKTELFHRNDGKLIADLIRTSHKKYSP